MLGRVFGGRQSLVFKTLAFGHHPVGEGGVAVAPPQLHDLEPVGLPLDIDPVAVFIKLNKDLQGILVVDGNGLQEEGVQIDLGQASQELPFAEILKPDLRALLAVELPVTLGGGDDGSFRSHHGGKIAIKIAGVASSLIVLLHR